MEEPSLRPRDMAARLLALARPVVDVPVDIVDIDGPLDNEFLKLGIGFEDLDMALKGLAYRFDLDLDAVMPLKTMSIRQITYYIALFCNANEN